VPFIFDPGQQLPMFDGAELRDFVEQASWVALNDYEARMLCERMGTDLAALSSMPHLRAVVVTLAADGCDVWQQGRVTRVAGVVASAVLDPTGCGDAFRAGLLFGLERGWAFERCAALGNRLGALKISCRGGQNHRIESSIVGT
jgi:adenosine kinase